MEFEKDIIKNTEGDIELTFIGHGTLMLEYNGKIIHVDPWSKLADYSVLPKADLVLITHDHPDHLDKKAVEKTIKTETEVVCTEQCLKTLKKIDLNIHVMKNEDSYESIGIDIKAVPAYNRRLPFHPKGRGNGYVLGMGSSKLYIAGDTENIPEMKKLEEIDIAFLPMNLPFTMKPETAADAARSFNPKILYPYHFGDSDTDKLVNLLEGSGIEIRVRKMS